MTLGRSSSYRTLNINARQNLSIWVFNSQNPDTLNGYKIFSDRNFNYNPYKDTSFIFGNVTPGSKYIGIWVHSNPNSQLLLIDNLVISRDTTFVGNERIIGTLPLRAMPNPARGSFTLTGLKGSETARIYDAQGRFMATTRKGQPVTALRPGLYLALAADGRRCRVVVE